MPKTHGSFTIVGFLLNLYISCLLPKLSTTLGILVKYRNFWALAIALLTQLRDVTAKCLNVLDIL